MPPRGLLALLQHVEQRGGGREARVAVLLQETAEHLLEVRRELRVQLSRRPRHVVHLPPHHDGELVVVERVRPRRQLVERQAERVQVGPTVDCVDALRAPRFARGATGGRRAELFRSRIPHRSDEGAGLRHAQRVAVDARDAEVHHLDDVVRRHDHVVRLHVAVHRARRVDGRERPRDLAADVAAELLGHARQVREQLAQRPSLDVLHDQEARGARRIDRLVGRQRPHDVLVAHAPADLRLATEPLERAFARQEVRVDHLHCDARSDVETG
jgi:hypothetical protein